MVVRVTCETDVKVRNVVARRAQRSVDGGLCCKEKGWGVAVGVAGGPRFPLTHKGRAFPRWGYVH